VFTSDDLDAFLDAFNAVDVTVKLSGVTVKTIRGIYKRSTEFGSPFETEQLRILPSLRCKESDLADVTRGHTLLLPGGAIEYKFWRDPVPSDSGFSVVGLVKA
jgi:hypothetical protein